MSVDRKSRQRPHGLNDVVARRARRTCEFGEARRRKKKIGRRRKRGNRFSSSFRASGDLIIGRGFLKGICHGDDANLRRAPGSRAPSETGPQSEPSYSVTSAARLICHANQRRLIPPAPLDSSISLCLVASSSNLRCFTFIILSTAWLAIISRWFTFALKKKNDSSKLPDFADMGFEEYCFNLLFDTLFSQSALAC